MNRNMKISLVLICLLTALADSAPLRNHFNNEDTSTEQDHSIHLIPIMIFSLLTLIVLLCFFIIFVSCNQRRKFVRLEKVLAKRQTQDKSVNTEKRQRKVKLPFDEDNFYGIYNDPSKFNVKVLLSQYS